MTQDGFAVGDHRSASDVVHIAYGGELIVDVVVDAMGYQHDPLYDLEGARVGLRLPQHEDIAGEGAPFAERLHRGEHLELYPEEARLLARFLVASARRCEAILAGATLSPGGRVVPSAGGAQ